MHNYHEFEDFLSSLKTKPKLLLHSCCGPCSSAVLELLNKYFEIDVFYYNPNIYPQEEFIKRSIVQQDLLQNLNNIGFILGDYNYDEFKKVSKDLETEPEGGKRCYECIKMRMDQAAKNAKENGYNYFTTTLSVSPHKNSKMINEIGYDLENKYNINYLYSDFKKKDGYKRSIILSKKYNLYRQDYCGCQYSKN